MEKQKIKSKWKAEKRKEGIFSRRDAATLANQEGEGDKVIKNDDSEDEKEGEKEAGRQPADEQLSEDVEIEEEDARESLETEALPLRNSGKNTQLDTDKTSEDRSTLRELQKQAYSRSSLHHYKSDPLHRSRGRGHGGGNTDQSGRQRGGRGGGGGRGRGRGGGQPDMRLRMSAMLEKIKHDFT